MTKPTMPNEYPAGSLIGAAPDPISTGVLHDFDLEGIAYDISVAERAAHGRDWWPLSLLDVNEGRVPSWPGVVVRATSSEQVQAIARIASAHHLPITAQGGRSGVEGGAVAPAGAIALDLTGLNQVLEVDEESGLVHVEAGVFGPDLETALNALGFTIGHFPQSFDISTVGGWLACRGAGQYSNRYGKIEDMVRALSVVIANGDEIKLGGRGPRQAVGPDLVQLFVGSEGALGIITEATLVIRRRPVHEAKMAFGFTNFDDGLRACRRVLQRGASPAVLRLYDDKESLRNFNVATCVLIVLDEGDPAMVEATMGIVAEECTDARALEATLVSHWLEERNDVSALAPLWEHGIIVDTIEVAGPWSRLGRMHTSVLEVLRALPATLVASVHQSHAYLDGACLYFTFAGNPKDNPVGYYRDAWNAATLAVLECGGTLSHHHGVGRNRARFVSQALASAYPLLVSLKATLDPFNIMNPGVLSLGGEPW